jgi:hypothetical protein
MRKPAEWGNAGAVNREKLIPANQSASHRVSRRWHVARKRNEHHMLALVLAAMITHQLGMRIACRIGAVVGRARLSHEKRYDLLAAFHQLKFWGLAEMTAFNPHPRRFTRDKPARQSRVESESLAFS